MRNKVYGSHIIERQFGCNFFGKMETHAICVTWPLARCSRLFRQSIEILLVHIAPPGSAKKNYANTMEFEKKYVLVQFCSAEETLSTALIN